MNYVWDHDKPYNDFSSYFRRMFDRRVQKISIDAGFTCPNRDGTKGRGGCTFCDNKTFNPAYCKPEKSITIQLDQGISFFKERYKTQKYLAYFQAYTNTYAELDCLKKLYSEALAYPEVIGLVIGTRPDCVSTKLFDYLESLNKEYYISLEFGVESTLDRSLERINRGHMFNDAVEAYNSCKDYSFKKGMHLILGLPGEEEPDILAHVDKISSLPFDFLKLHQLQIIKGTKMALEYQQKPDDFTYYEAEEYIDLVIKFIEKLNPDIIIERFISQSPPEKIITPKWGLKNFEFTAKLEKEMRRRGTWQGRLYNG